MSVQFLKSRVEWYWGSLKCLVSRYRTELLIVLLFLLPVIVALVLVVTGVLDPEPDIWYWADWA